MKFNPMEFIKDVSDLLVEKITPLKESVAALQEQMKGITPYDDEALVSLLDEQDLTLLKHKDAIEKLLAKEDPAPYDDSEVKATIKEVLENNNDGLEKLTKVFQDMGEASKNMNDALNKTIEDLYKKIEDQDAAYLKSIVDLTKQVEDKLDTVKDGVDGVDGKDGIDGKDGEFNKAIIYDTNPVDKGAFVIYKNSLWFNMLEDNDTPPSEDNHSYQLLVKAPKEIVHTGTYSEEKKYTQGDIANFNGHSWFKTNEPAQAIPSEGWKLLGKQGKQGKKGEVTIVENDTTEALQELSDKVLILESELKNVSKK